LENNKILVVDDDKDILTVLQIFLTQYNYIVQSIFRWELIDKTIELFSPDLIILDIRLAGADGRTICKRLKADIDTKHIPIILFSANTNVEKSFTDYNANDFIAKPFEIGDLIDKVVMHLPANPTLA
jgi:DNA-binding response OmpR family regulator